MFIRTSASFPGVGVTMIVLNTLVSVFDILKSLLSLQWFWSGKCYAYVENRKLKG